MKFVSDRWFLGPLAASLALYVCVTSSVENAERLTENMAGTTIERVYQLASQGKFDELASSGLVSADDVRYLKMQDECFGRVQVWKVDAVQSKSLGRGWSAMVQVTRAKTDFVEVLNGPNPHLSTVRPSTGVNKLTDAPYYDSDSYDDMSESFAVTINLTPDSTFQPALTSTKSAMERAKPLLWPRGDLKSATAEKCGDYWLVTAHFTTDSQADENGQFGKLMKTSYLVLTAGGREIELVESKDPAVRLTTKPPKNSTG